MPENPHQGDADQVDRQRQQELDSLGQKLANARREQASKGPKKGNSGKATGIAYRMAVELVLAVVVSVYIGYLLDGWLDTRPFLMLVFFFLGVAAGIRNVIRASDQMQNLERADRTDGSNSDHDPDQSP